MLAAEGSPLYWQRIYGEEWLEIRSTVATYRVPKYNYPSRLCRHIMDSSLARLVPMGTSWKSLAIVFERDLYSQFESDWNGLDPALRNGHVVSGNRERLQKCLTFT